MIVYKIKAEENGNSLYCVDWDDVKEYVSKESSMLIQMVEMSKKEYYNLPDFTGF